MRIMRVMRSNAGFLMLVLLVTCLPLLGFKYYRHNQERVSRTGFTVYATETITDSRGNTSVSQKYVFARRSDGAFVEQRQEVFRNVPTQSREVYFPDGRKAQVEDHVRAASTCYLEGKEKEMVWSGRPDPDSDCARSYLGGAKQSQIVTSDDKSFFGVSTTKVVQEGPSRRLTLWLAPSLSCQTLMRIAEFRNGNEAEYSNPSILMVDRIDLGEPDPSLFDVPPSYDDVPPSELAARNLAANGQTLSRSFKDRFSKVDARYFRQRANKR